MITVMGSRDSIWFRTNTERSTLERCKKTIIDLVLGGHGGGMTKGGLSQREVRGSFTGAASCLSTHWLTNLSPRGRFQSHAVLPQPGGHPDCPPHGAARGAPASAASQAWRGSPSSCGSSAPLLASALWWLVTNQLVDAPA